MLHRFSLIIIGIFGISGVSLGAFGAHALRDILISRGTQHAWETAVVYQLIHTLALLALTLFQISRPASANQLTWTGRFWMIGVLLFSGSIYALALGGPGFLGPITPLGGLAFILGWIYLIWETRNLSKTS